MEGQQSKSIFGPDNENIKRKIFEEIPRSHRWNLALTCRDFYETICGMDEKKYKMVIRPKHLEDSTTFASIIESSRIFDEVEILNVKLTHDNYKLLTKIIAKHGASVKTLRIDLDEEEHPSLDAKLLQLFFEKVPNLTFLWINDEFTFFKNMIGKCDAVLKHIKTLIYEEEYQGDEGTYTNQSFINFSSLIAPDTVEEFRVFQCYLNFKDFIQQQSTLKKIRSISCEGLDATVFNHLKLEKITLLVPEPELKNDDRNSFALQIVQHHRETLQKIKIGFMVMSAQLVESICQHLKHLKSFSFRFTNKNAESILGIKDLKELKKLKIEGFARNFNRFDALMELTRLKMASIQKLEISVSTLKNQFPEIMKNIGENWENIEKLKVWSSGSKWNVALENLPKLKILEMIELKEFSPVFTDNGQTYPLIKRFESGCCGGPFFLCALFIIFPNLEHLSSRCPYAGLIQLNGLLSLKKLKSLSIVFVITSPLMPSEETVAAIKQLCRKMQRYRLTFTYDAPNNYQRVIDALEGQFGDINYVERISPSLLVLSSRNRHA